VSNLARLDQPLRLALSFLTIIPSGVKEEIGEASFAKSVKYFPVIGFAIGLLLAGLYAVISTRLEGLASSAIVITALIIVTRALHLDGLADTFDGIFGGKDKEQKLAIMKDSRIGSFGMVSIMAVIGLKILLLSSISSVYKLEAIITFPVLGRWSACYAVSTQPYARKSKGLGSLFLGANKIDLFIASIIAFVIAAIFLGYAAILAAVVALVFAIAYSRFIKSEIGGMTGDTLGALIELTELAVIFILAFV